MNSTYEFNLKEGPKVKMKNFWRTKNYYYFLKKTKTKSRHIYRDQKHI